MPNKAIESGVNVAIEVPQAAIAKVPNKSPSAGNYSCGAIGGEPSLYHKKHVLYMAAPQELRDQRVAVAGHTAPDCVQGKPLGPNVSTITNNGTVAEGATSVVEAMQKGSKEVIAFPSSCAIVTVLRDA